MSTPPADIAYWLDPAAPGAALALAALAMVVAYVALVWSRRDLAAAGLLVLPLAAATLVIAWLQSTGVTVTRIAVDGGWPLLAVSLATWTACVLLGGVGLAELVKRPSRGSLGLSARIAAIAFVTSAVTLAASSVYSFRFAGSPWSGTAAETWTLFALLALALYMHSKLTLGWGRRALAVLALLVTLGAVMSLWQVRLPDDTLDTLSFAQRAPVESEEVS